MSTDIVLVDERIVRDGLRRILECREDFRIVGEASSCDEAVAVISATEPDVALLEVALPGSSGIEAIERLREVGAGTQLLVLTSHQSRPSVRGSLRAGASGYVVKAASSSDLIDAIDTACGGKPYLSPEIVELALEDLTAGERGAPGTLTPREREVLELICEGANSREIGEQLGIAAKTVDSHRCELMNKLGIHKVSGLVRYAIREGLVAP